MKTLTCTLICVFITTLGISQKLYKAVDKADLKKVQKLIDKGEDVNEYSRNGLFPLWRACANNDVKMAQLLLDHGADIYQQSTIEPYRSTALDYPCQEGYLEVVKLLVSEGAEVDAEGYLGMTPLLLASSYGHHNIVAYLIEQGATIDHQDVDGNFPLGEAARQGHLNVVRVLLQNGATPRLKNLYNKTAYDIAMANGHLAIADFLRSI